MNDPLNLTNRCIAITGAGGAIGRAIVDRFADRGAIVYALDLDEVLATLPADASRGDVRYVPCDVTVEADCRTAFDAFQDAGRMPDTVCCHAGITRDAPLVDHERADFDTVFAVNATGAFLFAREAVRSWSTTGSAGHLIFTTSWVQDVPWPGIAPYNASKAAVRSLMRGFAREYAADGVRANAVAPGMVDVGMARAQFETDPSYRRRAGRFLPLGSLQPVESVVDAFHFLVSDMAAWMTGSTLLVDGGSSLLPVDGEVPV